MQSDVNLQFVIRQANVADLEHIISINKQTLPENYPSYFFLEHLRDFGKAFFVAEVEGEVVGYIMPRIEWGMSNLKQLPSFLKKGHVVSIAVKSPFRGKGVGGSLLDNSMQRMREDYGAEEVYLEVRVSNSPAIHLYEKKGFKKVKVLRRYYMDGEDAYLMAAPLKR